MNHTRKGLQNLVYHEPIWMHRVSYIGPLLIGKRTFVLQTRFRMQSVTTQQAITPSLNTRFVWPVKLTTYHESLKKKQKKN